MLVLKRNVDNEIIIEHKGEKLRLVIVEAKNDVARIGFDGPRSFVMTRPDSGKYKELEINCPHCEKRALFVDMILVGNICKCPGCFHEFRV
jgi:sRNA-binding carbon storage regulator CsrA